MFSLRNLFLPDHKNDHRAQILKPQILSTLTLIFVLTQSSLGFLSFRSSKVLGYSSDISPERIIELTNSQRAAAGLSPLKENLILSEAAKRKAGDMFAFNYWAHVSPSGRDPWAFFKEAGYNYIYAGENLARDFRDPDSVVAAWMNSPTHKENLLSEKYQEIGVAVVDGSLQGIETTLVVQLFGSETRAVAGKQTAGESVKEKATTSEKIVSWPGGKPGETVLVNTEGEQAREINPFSVTKVVAIFMVGIILGAFFFDFFLVSEKKTPRLSGRSFAQLLFLGFILLIIFISKQGVIV